MRIAVAVLLTCFGGCGDSDILDELELLDGITVVEVPSDYEGYRRFDIVLEQPVDHNDFQRGSFGQHMTLQHRTTAAPVVLQISGYQDSAGPYRVELTRMLNANQLSVDHRYFGESRPYPTEWPFLTIAQAAADHHRIVDLLRPLYGEAWISSGFSKGGKTALYHRRFYPDDVVATVAYVAPISIGAPDDRYLAFFDTVADEECRQKLRNLQREVLLRREQMLVLLEESVAAEDCTFERIGGIDAALEALTISIEWTTWQYGTGCENAPLAEYSSDELLFSDLRASVGETAACDSNFARFDPYFYQAHTENGYPSVPRQHLSDLLRTSTVDLEEGLVPEGVAAIYDPGPVEDVRTWLQTSAERLLLIYGENDPWTAGAVELGDSPSLHSYLVANGNHAVGIRHLPEESIEEVRDTLHAWSGVEPEHP